MPNNILVTGGSGYLGGTLLSHWETANLPHSGQSYALVRTEAQASAISQYPGFTPLKIDFSQPSAIEETILSHKINIVFFLYTPLDPDGHTVQFIQALSKLKQQTGQEPHFLFTTGAKLFSSHAGARTDAPILDTDPTLYTLQKSQKAPLSVMGVGVDANNRVIETAEACGVRSYVFAPCIVYGKGEGFGNVISIQTVAVVRAARKLRQVYKVDEGRPTWPVCHVRDNTALYVEILRAILEGKDIGHGRNGYFLASPGSVAWDDVYKAFARALKKRGVVDEESVLEADEEVLGRMGKALECPKEWVGMMLGGECTFTAEHGKKIGWKPQYGPEHILEAADDEVELILQNMKD